MSEPLFQADGRWSSILLGHGPSHIGGAGCVLTSLAMAARELGTRPDLTPPHANNALLAAGAFVHWDQDAQKMVAGDELTVGIAAPVLGLEAPDDGVVVGDAGDAQLRDAVKRALGPDTEGRFPGVALLRVAFEPGGHGKHTILGVALDLYANVVRCIDPAIGKISLSWPGLEAVAVWGKGDVKKYHLVGIRPVRRVVQ